MICLSMTMTLLPFVCNGGSWYFGATLGRWPILYSFEPGLEKQRPHRCCGIPIPISSSQHSQRSGTTGVFPPLMQALLSSLPKPFVIAAAIRKTMTHPSPYTLYQRSGLGSCYVKLLRMAASCSRTAKQHKQEVCFNGIRGGNTLLTSENSSASVTVKSLLLPIAVILIIMAAAFSLLIIFWHCIFKNTLMQFTC